ncbi:MAG: hypothetical protein PHW04_02010 [Candidatus Wallbacteria bacterium]|nr:hypothetical protein [Candidatus Wallbacteria bacterium]
MKKIIIFFVFFNFACAFAEQVDDALQQIGYSYKDEILNKQKPPADDEQYPVSYFSRLAELSLGDGGLCLSGCTGLIELPTAFIASHGYCNVAGHMLYSDGDFNLQGAAYQSKKWEYIGSLNYGVRKNTECGVNFISVNNDISSIPANVNYSIRKEFATFHFKLATPYKGKAVAFGGQYTNLSNEDQLLMDYMDLEKMNGYYIAISDQVSPRLFTNFSLKNTFIRSTDIPPIHIERQDLAIAGAGLEYRLGYTSLLAEAKQLWGNYINDDNNLAFNCGARYRHSRISLDFAALNLFNGSDAIYSGGMTYTF